MTALQLPSERLCAHELSGSLEHIPPAINQIDQLDEQLLAGRLFIDEFDEVFQALGLQQD